MTIKKNLPLSPSSVKIRFTYRFMKALKRLSKKKPSSSPTKREKNRRYHKVKTAAYASMASAVGSRRRWSSVMLWKIKNRGLNHVFVKRNKRHIFRRRTIRRGENPRKDFGYGAASELQKLIPGGEVMDFYSLLDETADYIKCLAMQVTIMRNILDVCSE